MGETPHLPVISAYLREAHSKIVQQEANNVELDRKLEAHNQSIVFVEGESDVILLTKAWQVLMQQDMPFRFESSGGTTKMEGLSRDGKVLSNVAPGRKIFALVDNDTEGRSLYANSRLKTKGKWVRHNSNNVYWCRLPFNEGFERFMKMIGLPEKMWPGSLENLFSPAIKQRAVDQGALRINDCPHSEVIDQENFGRIRPYLAPRDDLSHFYLLTNHEDSKITFAQWLVTIVDEEPEILEPLRVVFDGLLACLTEDDD